MCQTTFVDFLRSLQLNPVNLHSISDIQWDNRFI